jgi:phage FluMu protein Com
MADQKSKEFRCSCGNLMFKILDENKIELKCKRCKRVIKVSLSDLKRAE